MTKNKIHGRPDNETEWFEDLLGRGAGDGDMYGYPGEPKYIGIDPPRVERHMDYETIASGRGYPWEENIDYDPRFDEDLKDNHASE